LAGCLLTSQFARCLVLNHQCPITPGYIEALAVFEDPSKARWYLADSCGCL
jgi:hypothetical protein